MRYSFPCYPDRNLVWIPKPLLCRYISGLTLAVCFLPACLALSCQEGSSSSPAEDFFERKNAEHGGDYLATYPLSNPDSCIARLRREVPPSLQPWGCLSLWYHLPRDKPEINFRLLELYERHYPHDTVFAFCQMVRAEFYVDLAKFDSAQICLDDARRRYLNLDRPKDARDADYLLARSRLYQNRFSEALDIYYELLDAQNAEDSTFSEFHANLYIDIWVAHERSQNRAQYGEWLFKARKADASKLSKPWLFRARTANGLSTYYHRTQPDSSIYWAKKALAIYQEAKPGSPPPAGLVHRLARAHFEAGDCETALPLFQDANGRNPHRGNLMAYYQLPLALGECHLCLNNLDSAEWYLQTSLASPDTGNLSVAHELLSELYVKRGDWPRALEAARESRRLYEIKFTSDRTKAVSELNARYESAQKEHRIAELEQERHAAGLRLLVGSLAFLFLFASLTALYFRQRGRRLVLEKQYQLLARENELATARAKLKAQALERSQRELRSTREELDIAAQSLKLKNALIEELKLQITQSQSLPERVDPPPSTAMGQALKGLRILTDQDWHIFRERFKENFPGFLNHLVATYPKLTSAEIRLFLLLKLKFNNKEIAETLGISQQSVWRSRHRLSKKLELHETSQLDDFIAGFGKQNAPNR